MNLKEQDK
ncbi:Protein of unknown function [Bacillus cereus]|uniref:Uncharacterized protein n=1 Tax=Bacillus wiedmannii TaxID=1890302 RepID=A0AB37YX73_9BACI|nr:Protein of unknown function [Bacillus wiedmannii]SCN07438.1 Protein of unknown function [Bacillus wiedmannii]SCV21815.1 Protein of unknown function [Bacillus cereus]